MSGNSKKVKSGVHSNTQKFMHSLGSYLPGYAAYRFFYYKQAEALFRGEIERLSKPPQINLPQESSIFAGNQNNLLNHKQPTDIEEKKGSTEITDKEELNAWLQGEIDNLKMIVKETSSDQESFRSYLLTDEVRSVIEQAKPLLVEQNIDTLKESEIKLIEKVNFLHGEMERISAQLASAQKRLEPLQGLQKKVLLDGGYSSSLPDELAILAEYEQDKKAMQSKNAIADTPEEGNARAAQYQRRVAQAQKLAQSYKAELIGAGIGAAGFTLLSVFLALDWQNPTLLKAAHTFGVKNPSHLHSAGDIAVFIAIGIGLTMLCAKGLGLLERSLVQGRGAKGVLATLFGGVLGEAMMMSEKTRDLCCSVPCQVVGDFDFGF